ncbi:MAG: hypothetical protein QOJ62_773, partial [Actinomycetota bacterium]|nr:hypothetical protein [Actinomycetota bacterium]
APVAVDLRHVAQCTLASRLAGWAAEVPHARQPGWRWHEGSDNRMYGRPDASVYYAMIADLKPTRVIEVGSGFSSAIALDAADRHSPETLFEFVEPYPDRLLGLLSDADRNRTVLHRTAVQDIPVEVFTTLQADDVLFIDSTHVAKTGSDVLYLYLDVLPRLVPGVIVHIHDIFWPFTYPDRWLRERRGWNETYLLRAMLMEPSALEIMLWPSWLHGHHPELSTGPGAGAIWLRRR